eukprot:scaffold23909_cov40-Phaeocystis_antarctica.AAC.1
MRPRQALLRVLSLLAPEHVGVELLLQPLVGEVDAQLLEGVGGEALEAVDVEDANGGGRGGRVDEPLVAAADEPTEEAAVQRLARGVARLRGLRHRARHEGDLVAHLQVVRVRVRVRDRVRARVRARVRVRWRHPPAACGGTWESGGRPRRGATRRAAAPPRRECQAPA